MTVTLADLGAARVITWDRQERRNAWDLPTMTAIAAEIEVAGRDTAVRMIAVGEESGSLDKQLTHLALEYRKRLDTLIKSLSEIIKPAIILVAGGLFLFLIVALLLPVYDLVQQSVQQSLGGR